MAYNKRKALRDNIEAIRLVLQRSKSTIPPFLTAEQHKALSRYKGFGGLKFVLNPIDKKEAWSKSDLDYYDDVKELYDLIEENAPTKEIAKEYWNSIKNSVLTSFYTPNEVSDAIVGTISKYIQEATRDMPGYELPIYPLQGILDPSAGVGSFIGTAALRSYKPYRVAVEKDYLTAEILRTIDSGVRVEMKGFEEFNATNLTLDGFDLVTSNIPFGDIAVFDKQFGENRDERLRQSQGKIHNYFFAKGLESTREGGLVAFIAPRGILDSKGNRFIREYLMENSHLISVLRLPDGMFSENAGTEAGSDLIILQKDTEKKGLTVDEDRFCRTVPVYDVYGEEVFAHNALFEKTDWKERAIATYQSNSTNLYGEETYLYKYLGSTKGIAAEIEEKLNRDLKANFNRELYLAHYVDKQERAQRVLDNLIPERYRDNKQDISQKETTAKTEDKEAENIHRGINQVGAAFNLITKGIAKDIPALYGQENIEVSDKIAYARYFAPGSAYTSYLLEYDPEAKEGFGLVSIGYGWEFGYISLKELEDLSIDIEFNGKILGKSYVERDLFFKPTPLGQIKELEKFVEQWTQYRSEAESQTITDNANQTLAGTAQSSLVEENDVSEYEDVSDETRKEAGYRSSYIGNEPPGDEEEWDSFDYTAAQRIYITQDLLKDIPAIGKSEGKPLGERTAYCRYENLGNNFSAYLLEYSPEWDMAFGLKRSGEFGEFELGHFKLEELGLMEHHGLTTMRDLNFAPKALKEIPELERFVSPRPVKTYSFSANDDIEDFMQGEALAELEEYIEAEEKAEEVRYFEENAYEENEAREISDANNILEKVESEINDEDRAAVSDVSQDEKTNRNKEDDATAQKIERLNNHIDDWNAFGPKVTRVSADSAGKTKATALEYTEDGLKPKNSQEEHIETASEADATVQKFEQLNNRINSNTSEPKVVFGMPGLKPKTTREETPKKNTYENRRLGPVVVDRNAGKEYYLTEGGGFEIRDHVEPAGVQSHDEVMAEILGTQTVSNQAQSHAPGQSSPYSQGETQDQDLVQSAELGTEIAKEIEVEKQKQKLVQGALIFDRDEIEATKQQILKQAQDANNGRQLTKKAQAKLINKSMERQSLFDMTDNEEGEVVVMSSAEVEKALHNPNTEQATYPYISTDIKLEGIKPEDLALISGFEELRTEVFIPLHLYSYWTNIGEPFGEPDKGILGLYGDSIGMSFQEALIELAQRGDLREYIFREINSARSELEANQKYLERYNATYEFSVLQKDIDRIDSFMAMTYWDTALLEESNENKKETQRAKKADKANKANKANKGLSTSSDELQGAPNHQTFPKIPERDLPKADPKNISTGIKTNFHIPEYLDIYGGALESNGEGRTGMLAIDPESNSLGVLFNIDVNTRNAWFKPLSLENIRDLLDKEKTTRKQESPEVRYIHLYDYVTLRDCYCRLYNTERETRREDQEDRILLNTLYDRYVKKYRWLNNKNEAAMLKREDALFPGVSSIEVLLPKKTEKSGNDWGKSDIFFEPVAFDLHQEALKVEGPTDAFLSSIDEKGYFDMSYVQSLLPGMSKEAIMSEMDGKVYYDPFSQSYELREDFLKGNIREKIRLYETYVAENPEDTQAERSLAGLRLAVPEKIPFPEIKISLGERWIEPQLYTEFARYLLREPKILVEYTKSADLFTVNFPGGYEKIRTAYDYSIDEYLVKSSNGRVYTGQQMLGYVLQGTRPEMTITIEKRDPITNEFLGKESVADIAGLRSFEEKAEIIKSNWSAWLDAQPYEVKERLEEKYNNLFNNEAVIDYDGSHQTFPDLSFEKFKYDRLYKTQEDAIWMLKKNEGGIIDHEVGGGKTMIMCVAAHEMKRLGIIDKPMIVGLKANIIDIGETYKKAYPNDKVLFPTKSQTEGKQMITFLNTLKNNKWDCVILTHDQFIRIPHTKEAMENALREEIRELDQTIVSGRETKNMSTRDLNGLEKRKSNLVVRIKDLNEKIQKRKYDMQDFQSLGIDHLFVDESHHFKTLGYSTRHTRVSGLGPKGASQRAFNMSVAVRSIQDRKGKDLCATFVSGTPIKNSVAELYLLFKYLRPRALEAQGLNTFDAWASVYAEKSVEYEFSVTNEIKMKDRFRRFKNAPELGSFYRYVTDYRRAVDIGIDRPKANNQLYAVPQSETQKRYMEKLIEFAKTGEATLVGRLPENERMKKARMLIVTGLSAKMSLDMRLIDAWAYEDDANSKLNHCVRKAAELYHKYDEWKGTQFIFSDLGSPGTPSSKENNYFDIYSEVKRKLVEDYEIPEEEIGLMVSNLNENGRQKLCDKMNSGEVRILIGSTKTMGTGINAQERAVAVHHLDVPWVPADNEQRTGRAVRAGNWVAKEHAGNEVQVFFYATERSLDAYKYELLNIKQGFIDHLKTNTVGARILDEGNVNESNDLDQDAGSTDLNLSYAEFVAIVSGNENLKKRNQVEKEVQVLEAQQASAKKERYSLEKAVNEAKEQIEKLEGTIGRCENDKEVFEARLELDEEGNPVNKLEIYGLPGDADIKTIAEKLQDIEEHTNTEGSYKMIGKIYDFPIMVKTELVTGGGTLFLDNRFFVRGKEVRLNDNEKPKAVFYTYNNGKLAGEPKLKVMNFLNALGKIDSVKENTRKHIDKISEELTIKETLLSRIEFPQEKEIKLAELKKELLHLEREIANSLRRDNNEPREQAATVLNIEGLTEEIDDYRMVDDMPKEEEEIETEEIETSEDESLLKGYDDIMNSPDDFDEDDEDGVAPSIKRRR